MNKCIHVSSILGCSGGVCLLMGCHFLHYKPMAPLTTIAHQPDNAFNMTVVTAPGSTQPLKLPGAHTGTN